MTSTKYNSTKHNRPETLIIVVLWIMALNITKLSIAKISQSAEYYITVSYSLMLWRSMFNVDMASGVLPSVIWSIVVAPLSADTRHDLSSARSTL
jgi:hypothetical protein